MTVNCVNSDLQSFGASDEFSECSAFHAERSGQRTRAGAGAAAGAGGGEGGQVCSPAPTAAARAPPLWLVCPLSVRLRGSGVSEQKPGMEQARSTLKSHRPSSVALDK